MRVAFIRYRYDPFGGAERFTQLLMDHLAGRGVEVHLFAHRWKAQGLPNVILHTVGGPTWPALLAYGSFVHRVGKAVSAGHFDLVQSNERTLCQHIYRAGDGVHARWLDLRLERAGWLRRVSIRTNPFHWLRLVLERKLFESPSLEAVIVNSNMVRGEILERFRIEPERIHTIYNGVDLKRFHPSHRREHRAVLRARCGVDEGRPVALFVGSGFERKGIDPLLRSLGRSRSGVHLWVVGKGRISRYERLSRQLNLEGRVTFWGPQADVAPFYAAADCFLLPTLYDPFPSVILEAMASGLPVITTRQCGAAEIIDEGVTGYVVDSPRAIDLLADRIDRLADPACRETMGQNARKRAEAFPIARTVTELEELYDRLLSTRHPS